MKIINPVLKGFNPDPSICKVGEDYYIAVSTFEWFPGVQIHHSKDLVNWRLVAHPLQRVSQLDMKGNPNSGGVWAPCLSYSDGKFWLIYTDVKVVEGAWKDCHNYLVTCETVNGDWGDPIKLNSSGFDASLFHDTDGKKYLLNMLWDQRIDRHSFGGIVIQEYSDEEKKLIGKPKVIFKGTDRKLTEAPHLYHIGNYYYLLTAEGGTRFEHAATMARSTNIEGPYEVHPDNPILTSWHDPGNPLQKCGHASIVQTHTGEWYLAHLTGRPIHPDDDSIYQQRGYCPLGRETAIQKLYWRDEWPYVVGGKEGSLEVEAPSIPETMFEATYPEVDEFEDSTLNINFQTLRIPFTNELGSLTQVPNHLRLYGHESLTSTFTQAFVARRWQSLHFEAETAVEFYPENFQQAAGLVNYYNTENWTALQVTHDEELGRILELTICDNFSFSQPLKNKIAIPREVKYVYLRVNIEKEKYYYFYSFNNEDWLKIDIALESKKLSDDYIRGGGFFTGAFVGMQCQDTSGNHIPADFRYFRYKEK
ncbi:xylan 1,4-beta-xylosidase [Bacillus mojavensis]|uniref:xylan 1,4-beta-xylosidase n=1 Tax=Bacillus mojavensis TaxID=72360 RepID=UPI002DB5C452|nr:xylan 1,4-beta-xylosidase [Bacillus mojavensis]MEC1738232.1 xylan 1,4-beta-xylosidase [Bacillus mojavensis]MEC1794549.1 xylan 1,4-beta-xylosidase [Bacillus mojavensis]